VNGSQQPPARLLRKDAERNRQRILAAAAEVFTERGLDATLDDVARHAGVGVGTVYRRFPDKASLADALFDERIDALAAMAERAQAEPDAWAGLVSFLEHSAEMLASDRGLRQILMFAAQGHDRVAGARDRMRPAIDSLLKRAQADGQVRADLAATDIPIIEFMLAAVAEYARQVRPAVWRRYLALMLDALRTARPPGSPLPEPELSPDEMVQVLNSNPLSRRPAPHKPATVTVRP
jgi:AcrR family transcriptional regulator